MTTEPRADSDSQTIERELRSLRSAWAARGQAEPPELVDQAVLNAARRELAKPTRPRPLRWLGATATAVVVVLALAIVVHQQERTSLPGALNSDGFKLERSTTTPAATDNAPNMASQPQAPAGVVSQGLEARSVAPEASVTAAPPIQADRPDNEAIPHGALAKEQTPQDLDATMADAADALAEGVEVADPEAWIERLLKLRQEGRDDELRVELAAFRKAWPDHPLPPELGG